VAEAQSKDGALMPARPRFVKAVGAIGVGVALLVFEPVLAAPPSQSGAPLQILKQMTDYMAAQKDLSTQVDIELDVITPQLEKIRFLASGQVQISRPDKVRMSRKGGYSDVVLTYDGHTATAVDRYHNSYAQLESAGTVDQLIETLRSQYQVDMPGADLMLTHSYDQLTAGVIEAKEIGIGVVDGVDCHHLAFRNADTDWQLWVRTGDQPLPCKYVIITKTLAAAPEYAVTFHAWSTEPVSPGAFQYVPSADAKATTFAQLGGFAELPAPAAP
jgi:hypothetical protein